MTSDIKNIKKFNDLSYSSNWTTLKQSNNTSSNVNQIVNNNVEEDEVTVNVVEETENLVENNSVEYNVEDIAFDVLQGKYSTGQEQIDMLTAEGYDYNLIANKVAEITPIYLTALEIINGSYSYGEERKNLLTEAGYDYNLVQNMVNKILNIDVVHEVSDNTTEVTNSNVDNVQIEVDEQSGLAKEINGVSGSYYTGDYVIVNVDGKEFVVFKQNSDEFIYEDYPYGDRTIGRNGCAPTVVSIIASGYGIEVTPSDIVSDGNYHSDYLSVQNDLDELGLKYEHKYFNNSYELSEHIDYIISELEKGNQIAQPGYTSTGVQHWISFLDYNADTNQIYVADPYEESGWYNVDELKNRIQGSTISISGIKE